VIKVKSGTIYAYAGGYHCAFSEQLQRVFPRATHVFMSPWKEFFSFWPRVTLHSFCI